MSGGEQTRFKLAHILSDPSVHMIFADEPTSSIDIAGIELLETMFAEYRGALVIVSHDRDFLDRICSQILEVEAGRIKLYPGNYSSYAALKSQEQARQQHEYEQYIKERRRLETAAATIKRKSEAIKGPPKRMGNSEARLHKMGGQKGKATLDRAVKNIEKRIEKLEVKEKPYQPSEIKLDLGSKSSLPAGLLSVVNRSTKLLARRYCFVMRVPDLRQFQGGFDWTQWLWKKYPAEDDYCWGVGDQAGSWC